MTEQTLNEKAKLLRSYHDGDPVLVLPNVWDAGSAAVVAAAGARAIATTSGGVAWSLGLPDGQRVTRDEMVGAIARIVAMSDLPVTADVEAGYGPAPEDVAATVTAVVGAGAVGINLEDSQGWRKPLFTVDDQVLRIRAARDAAAAASVPDLVINARTDVYLFGIGEPEGRLAEVRRRGEAFAAAGADCLFVPALLDLEALASLVATSAGPVSAMASPGGPSVAELSAAGVRRISVGTAIAQAAYATAKRAAEELLASGTYDALADAIPFADLNGLIARARPQR